MSVETGDFLIKPEGSATEFSHAFNSTTQQSGKQAAIVSNPDGFPAAFIAYDVDIINTIVDGDSLEVYLIRKVGGKYDDGAGATAGAWTPKNAVRLKSIALDAGSTDNQEGVIDTAVVGALGPDWTIGIFMRTSTADTHGTLANVSFQYQYYKTQVQL